jgi:hypothetical protein
VRDGSYSISYKINRLRRQVISAAIPRRIFAESNPERNGPAAGKLPSVRAELRLYSLIHRYLWERTEPVTSCSIPPFLLWLAPPCSVLSRLRYTTFLVLLACLAAKPPVRGTAWALLSVERRRDRGGTAARHSQRPLWQWRLTRRRPLLLKIACLPLQVGVDTACPKCVLEPA